MLSLHERYADEQRRYQIKIQVDEWFSPFGPWSSVERRLARFSVGVVILSTIVATALFVFDLTMVTVVQLGLAVLCLLILVLMRYALVSGLIAGRLPRRLVLLGAFSLRPSALTMVLGLSALAGTAGSFLWVGSALAAALVLVSAGSSISFIVMRSLRR